MFHISAIGVQAIAGLPLFQRMSVVGYECHSRLHRSWLTGCIHTDFFVLCTEKLVYCATSTVNGVQLQALRGVLPLALSHAAQVIRTAQAVTNEENVLFLVSMTPRRVQDTAVWYGLLFDRTHPQNHVNKPPVSRNDIRCF
jgi:hypothetical protein